MTSNLENPAQPARSWLIDRPLQGPALPSGRAARLWGWLLLLNRKEQLDVLDYAGVRRGERVLEVGCGPGQLLRLLQRTGAEVSGVDPAPKMCQMARRRARGADVREGTAEATTHPDAAFDTVISVNNVPMWSSLDAGFGELRRVLRPGGRLIVSWHGNGRLALPAPVLERIELALRDTFGTAERHRREHVELFVATRLRE